MRLHRFYVEQKIGENKEISLTDSDFIHQLENVFRFKVGNQVILFDGSSFEYVAEIISLNKKPARLHSGGEIKLNILKSEKKDILQKNISLYLSVIKKNNFELAVEKCTEIGVTEIHPIISERSEKKDLNIERLNKIVKEASEQSGRVTLPTIFSVVDLDMAVSQAKALGKECVVFHTDSDSSTSPAIRMAPSPHPMRGSESGSPLPLVKGRAGERLCLFVGPEGGWTEKEMELFKKNNFQIHSLGQNILRVETAAMVAVWEANKS